MSKQQTDNPQTDGIDGKLPDLIKQTVRSRLKNYSELEKLSPKSINQIIDLFSQTIYSINLVTKEEFESLNYRYSKMEENVKQLQNEITKLLEAVNNHEQLQGLI